MTPTAPGLFLYLDPSPDAEPQPVRIVHDGERLVVQFDDGDEAATVLLADCAGQFTAAAPDGA